MKTESVERREDIEQAAAAWIARRDSGAWTETDAIAFEEWLARSVGHRAAYYRLNAAWMEAGRVRALGGAAPARSPMRSPRKRIRVFAIAASILVVLLTATLITFQDEIFRTNRFTTLVGGLQAVPMSDGSRVTLNTDTRLRISLNERERTIDLERGEAFFEVAHDPARPFIVKAGDRRVIAVGTQFSVRWLGANLRVAVTEGTVRYENAAGATGEAVVLPTGSVARAQGNAVVVQQKPITDIERTLTWRSGLLTFRNTPLAEAVAEFNRYNTRKIVIEDPSIATLEVGGIFRFTNLDSFVRLLEQGFPVQAKMEADRIILTRNPRI